MFLRNFLKHSTLIIFFFFLKNISSILLHFIASKFCWLPLNSETGRSSKLKLDGNLTLGRDFSQNWSLANIEHLNKGLIRSGEMWLSGNDYNSSKIFFKTQVLPQYFLDNFFHKDYLIFYINAEIKRVKIWDGIYFKIVQVHFISLYIVIHWVDLDSIQIFAVWIIKVLKIL